MEVLNHDLVGYTARLDRFMEEIHMSSSSGVSGMSVFDQNRLQSYIDALRALKAHQELQPQLDLPESHGNFKWDIGNGPQLADVENESINDILNLCRVLRFELANSQAARVAAGWNVHDSSRADSLVDKVESLLVNYVQVSTPLDLPESSPLAPKAPSGRLGT
jgi:hypothetical protein